jgi:hypothetical protein
MRVASSSVLLTIDLDWSPEWLIQRELQPLISTPVTIFMTHRSKWIEDQIIFGAPWEYGIHPNFEEKSTHGDTPQRVLQNLITDFPSSRIWRSHSLMNSTRIHQAVSNFQQLNYSSNYYDPFISRRSPTLRKFNEKVSIEIPIHFEDDLAVADDKGFMRTKHLIDEKDLSIVKVFSFHLCHIFLNTSQLAHYERYRSVVYSQHEPERNCSQSGYGTRNVFHDLLDSNDLILSLTDYLKFYEQEK